MALVEVMQDKFILEEYEKKWGFGLKGYIVAGFCLIVAILVMMGTGAYSSVFVERETSLALAEDPAGLIALSPGTDSYFLDTDGDGAYELYIEDIQAGSEESRYDVILLTNNLNQELYLSIIDQGAHSDNVTFVRDGVNIETGGIYVGSGEQVSISVDVNALSFSGDETLIDDLDIILTTAAGSPIVTLDRIAVVATTGEGETYDPRDHTMPSNAEYLRQKAYAVLTSGGSIRTHPPSKMFEDLGVDTNLWNGNINGYFYYYVEWEDYNDMSAIVVDINRNQGVVVETHDGSSYTLDKWDSLYLGVYDAQYYANVGGSIQPVDIVSYY